MKGYSSHGHFCSLREVLELEIERGNQIEEIKAYLGKFGDKEAIWVCYDPLVCFRRYCHDSDGMLIGNLTARELIEKFPDYLEQVVEIDLSGMDLICSDSCEGFLYAKNKNMNLF